MATPSIGWKAYNEQRKERQRAYFVAYHIKHADKKREAASLWYYANRDAALAKQRELRLVKPPTDQQKEAKRQSAAKRRAADPAKSKDARHRERA